MRPGVGPFCSFGLNGSPLQIEDISGRKGELKSAGVCSFSTCQQNAPVTETETGGFLGVVFTGAFIRNP